MPDYAIGWFVWGNKLFEAHRFGNLVEEKEIVDVRLSTETYSQNRVPNIGFSLVTYKVVEQHTRFRNWAHPFFFPISWKN